MPPLATGTALDTGDASCFSKWMGNIFYLDEYRRRRDDSRVEDDPEPKRTNKVQTEVKRRAKLKLSNRVQIEVKRRAKLDPTTNTLQTATPIILYQVSWGRNAWHSTWIARYKRNTLKASRKEAEAFIRERLKQGTSYRMTVMPGWHLRFRDASFLVAEINTRKPFERLNDPAFARPGVVQDEALELLQPTSGIWSGELPSHDSVIVQQTRKSADEFELWSERTDHPNQVRTPGPYKREIDGARWWMAPVSGEGPIQYDTSAFERALALLSA